MAFRQQIVDLVWREGTFQDHAHPVLFIHVPGRQSAFFPAKRPDVFRSDLHLQHVDVITLLIFQK
ncbi:hypothetical protein AWI33_05550 [Klebsiella aerogenes]|nr:hypothetical protein SR70_12085 [Klebsiella aerogenes]KUR15558.1 hypothetical protein AWI33_05550 [Klebsiella aerogenes]KUR28883.1 hypothetical protein AWI37_00320 [Klebsiella aerogenes]